MAPPQEPQHALGAAIRALRAERGLTQEDLAHHAGITTGTLSLIERGQSNPTWSTVVSIAGALAISIGELAKTAEQQSQSR